MNQTVTLEFFYPHSPERVWQALTDRRALAAWMMENDFEPRLGHKFHFRQAAVPGVDRYIRCEVIELEPLRRLAYRWQEDQAEPSMIVTWTLTPVAGGTTLQLRHAQPVQMTAVSPSILLQRFVQSTTQTEPRAMFDSIPHEKGCEARMSVLTGDSLNNDSPSLQQQSSISLMRERSLKLQAQWHYRLSRLNQTLSSDTMSDELTQTKLHHEIFKTENNRKNHHVED